MEQIKLLDLNSQRVIIKTKTNVNVKPKVTSIKSITYKNK